jgi:hypothetical protein
MRTTLRKVGFTTDALKSGLWWGTSVGIGWTLGEWLAEWMRYNL